MRNKKIDKIINEIYNNADEYTLNNVFMFRGTAKYIVKEELKFARDISKEKIIEIFENCCL